MEPRPENYQNIFWDFVTNQHEYPVTNGRKVSILELMKELQGEQHEKVLIEMGFASIASIPAARQLS